MPSQDEFPKLLLPAHQCGHVNPHMLLPPITSSPSFIAAGPRQMTSDSDGHLGQSSTCSTVHETCVTHPALMQ